MTKPWLMFVFTASVACTSSTTPSTDVSPERVQPALSIVGATLIDPRAASTPNSSIVIRDGRIVCAGTRSLRG